LDTEYEKLLNSIEIAEDTKRRFVRANPNGSGDTQERRRLYDQVEQARRALRDYKRHNPHLF